MPRIAGIDIPEKKKIGISLRYIFGIGPKVALDILREVGVDPERRTNELAENEIAQIAGVIDTKIIVEGALRRQIQTDIQRLKDIRTTAATVTVAACPSRGSARVRTRAPARAARRPSPARRA